MYHKHGRMPALKPSIRKVIEQTVSTIEESLFFRQDPPQQTIYPHNTRSSFGDTMWLQR